LVNNIEEINKTICSLTEQDYHDRLKSIMKNFELCKKYAFFWDRLNEYILN